MSRGRCIQALSHVQKNQTYEAEYVTTGPRRPEIHRGIRPGHGCAGHLEPTRNGPPFLLVGADITAMTDNVTRGTLDLRLINNDLGGYRSELRSDLRIGFLTQASTEYYRLLRANGLFVQPHAGLLRQPVYIFDNQHRIAERLQQNAGGGLDFGRTYHSRSQLAAEWRYEAVRWHTQSGNDFRPDLSGTAQTGVLHYTYNSLNAGQLSTRGVLFDVAGGALYHSLASQNAPVAHAQHQIFERLRRQEHCWTGAIRRYVFPPQRGRPAALHAGRSDAALCVVDRRISRHGRHAGARSLPAAHRVAAYTTG